MKTTSGCNQIHQVAGLVQERGNSIANAMEFHLSGTNPLKFSSIAYEM